MRRRTLSPQNLCADNWRRFRGQWQNYVVASDLTDATDVKRVAVFLTCISAEAYDVYWAMHFESADDSKKIEPILCGFESFCVGAVNETYESYRFNKRAQGDSTFSWAKYVA